MVFAAGLGTRLRPLTDNMPKALVPVGGTPMLERVITHLIASGVDEIVVNVHHFAQQIIDFLRAKDNFGIRIDISDESDLLLDTGGGIRKARPFLDGNEPFLIHNADILTDLNIWKMYEFHTTHNADVTLLTADRTTSRYLLFDHDNCLRGWTNIKTGEVKPEGFVYNPTEFKKTAYGCLQVVSPSIFRELEKYAGPEKFSIIPFYLSVCNQLKIVSYQQSDYKWFDIGSHETLAKAEEWIKTTI